jgi:DNA polymerase III psi subunit
MQQNTIAGGDTRAGPDQMSGQITYSMYKKCYGVMVVDLERVSDSTVDDLIRSIQVSWVNSSSLAYDYCCILIEFENQIEIDSVTGQVVASDGGI